MQNSSLPPPGTSKFLIIDVCAFLVSLVKVVAWEVFKFLWGENKGRGGYKSGRVDTENVLQINSIETLAAPK